jgi:DNA invertase Pin-like site-specific DNA recombinase
MILGYARVSTNGQELSLQQDQLKAAGCERVYYEKASGARADRSQLCRMLKALNPGDVIIVSRLDRLARSSRDLLNIIHQINDAGATFKSLADAWCDTTTAHGKLILTVLAGLAEFERSLIWARTQAGIARARELGKAFGRPPRLGNRQKRMIAERYAAGETIRELAETFGVGVGTIHRALKGR